MSKVSRFIVAAALCVTSSLAAQQTNGYRVRTIPDTLSGAVGGIAVDRSGSIFVADFGDQVFRVYPDGRVTVFATGLYGASGNAVDSRGNLLQSSFFGNFVSRIDRLGNAETIATGIPGPVGIAVDPQDNFYVTSCPSNSLMYVTHDGDVSTFVQDSLLNCPNGVTRMQDGTLYVVNFSDMRVIKVTTDGTASVLAQLPGGGNGHITNARGELYATSFQGHRIYRITLDGGVTLIAGTGAFGGQDGDGATATFTFPNGIAAGPLGDRLYVNDFINRFPPTTEVPPAPKSTVRQITFPSFSSTLTAALQSAGIGGMEEAYRAWKTDPSTAGVFTETEVNAMGYALMNGGALPSATRLFELNVESYPNSWNVYDSLAEAYMNAGQTSRAIQFYERSLEINPANTNATAMLQRLRG